MRAGRLPGRLAIVTLMVAMAMVSAQRAQRASGTPAPPNFDVRIATEAGAASFMARNVAPAVVAGFSAQRAGAQAQLQSLAAGVDVVDAPEMAVPEIVSARPGTGFLTAATNNRAGAMRAFLAANSSFYGLSTDQVGSLELVADYMNPAGNMAWVEFEQRINGLPVFRGLIRGGFTSRGELARTTGQLAAGLEPASLPTAPGLSAAEAVSLAGANVGWDVSAGALGQAVSERGRLRLARGSTPMVDDARAWQMYFPLAPGVARLAWATEIWGDPDAFLIVVDAFDGTVLFRKNLTEYQTQAATYRIYADDSPAPLSPSTVLPGSGTQAPQIPSVLVTLIGNEGINAFNNLGWLTDGSNTTDGNNVQAGIDRDGVNGVDAPVTGSSRTFDFTINPQVDDPLTNTYQNAEVTDTFYWTNLYHDRLYLLGFTEAARNFQNDNFGRGGVAADRISAESQDSIGVNNANFSTPTDGGRGRMQMFIFTGPVSPNTDRTSGLDHDVLLHELTHGTSNRLHNNASGLTTSMSRGMGEGWSDFYARALLSGPDEDPNGIFNTGGWVTFQLGGTFTDNYYYGIRRFPYAVKTNVGANGKAHNPLTFADIDNTQISLTDGAFPRGVGGSTTDAFEVHAIGEIWALALHEVRARYVTRLGFAVGHQRFMQFATDAMKLDPTNPTMLQGRDSLVAAANAGGGTAADVADIWAGFATRGMGVSAQILNLTTGLVVEAFDLPGIAPTTVSLVSEAFPNARLDPAELVTASLCVTNNAGVTSGSVTGTLLATGGVTSPSAPQGYGTVGAGATVCRDFVFTVGATCGSRVTATLQIDETGAASPNITYSLQVGSLPAPFFSENFDGVTAPALPAGWTTSNLSGASSLWVTNSIGPDTAPNRAFVSQPTIVGDNVLMSPPIVVPAGVSQLSFRNSFSTETFADGGVLEMSTDGGPFVDALIAGGRFVSGGYSGKISPFSDGPLLGRLAWTNTSNGFVTTVFELPQTAIGKTVVFRWRSGTDTGTSLTGWSIDTVGLSSFVCSNDAPAIAVQPPSQTIATGDNGALTVFAAGTPSLTYQWFQGTSPNTASPIAGATSALFVTPPLTNTTSYWVRVSNGLGVQDSNTATVTVSNTITATATFDSILKVPRCATPGGVCDSGPALLNGRANIPGGPEPNQPNTLVTSVCADGLSGEYHDDESIDRIKVSTLDGSPMAPGKTVRVDVSAWIFAAASDRLDLFFSATTVNPVWTLIGTVTPSGTGAQTLSATYTLPAGARQVVRANLRDGGSATPCSFGTFDDHDDLAFAVSPSASVEMVTNGNFSTGSTGWSLWEAPNIVSSVVGGVFQFFQNTPPVGSGQATVFQNTGQPVIAGAPLLATFELGNSSSVRKRISVLVLEQDFSDLSVCTFWLPPNQTSLKTYTMRTHTTRNWSNASIYFYSATPGPGGNYLVDNVSLKYVPGQASDRTECVDPNAPALTAGAGGSNLLVNGDFASGNLLPGWSAVAPITTQVTGGVLEFLRPNNVTPAGNIMQATGVTALADQLFTATFTLGNSSTVRKRVTVLLHDMDLSVNPDLTACTFVLPAGLPLSNYTMRGRSTRAWTNATISFYAATVGLEQWIRLDDVTLAKSAPNSTIGTECIEPVTIPFPPGFAGGNGGGSQSGKTSTPPAPRTSSVQGTTSSVRQSDGPRLTDEKPFSDAGGGWAIDATATRREVLRWAEPIDLSRATGATLNVWSLLSARTSSAEIQVSLDGITWDTLAYVPPTLQWTMLDFDLDAYAGRTIYIQFVFDAVAPNAGVAPDAWRFHDAVVTLRGVRGGG